MGAEIGMLVVETIELWQVRQIDRKAVFFAVAENEDILMNRPSASTNKVIGKL
jgi:hypothetical protein